MVSYAFLVASTSWKAFCLVQLLLMSNLLQYLMLVPTGSFLDVWVCEYVDVLNINAKLIRPLSMVTITNFQ